MTKLLECAIWSLIAFLGFILLSQAHAATVFYKQPGQFEQCKSALGSYKYVCIAGTGCAPNTLKCVEPVAPVVVAPVVVAPIVVVSPTCGLVQSGLMPAVDTCKNMAPNAGFNTLRIQPTSEIAQPSDKGAFRLTCAVSHMNNDDAMVFPNQQGATHHHTYYGNTNVKFDTNLSTLSSIGNSTCQGGTMNRSAYWHPSMIDTTTNAPVLPDGAGAGFYYKTGYDVANIAIKAPPKGLRILAGNPKATSADQVQAVKYVCMNPVTQDSDGMPWQKAIPNCKVGHWLQFTVVFPQCWDGINLDSPNHKDHMAYPTGTGCPATHPVAIPEITLNMRFTVKSENQALNWRLASDNYAKNGANSGYSGHADYIEGWDRTVLDGIIKNCLNASKDAKAYLLCDGRMIY